MNTETIKTIIEKIDSKELLLPALQRKLVWSEDKMINLFDSIMKGYPFGGFIFWNIINKDNISRYHFYQFIKDYSERENTINVPSGKIVKESINVVMDGQQRLTSLYIGIKGSITTKEKWKRTDKAESYKKKHLYIVPHLSPDQRNEDETPFRFYFVEDDYAKSENNVKPNCEKYYLVADYYGKTQEELYNEFGVKRLRADDEDWRCILNKLRWLLNEAKILNYHTINNTNIEDVLEIFKRINNAGTPLSPANLLFSTVITSWENGRDKMDEFIQSINKEGTIIIREDYLIRVCVYLMNCPAANKIETLTKDVIKTIETNWDKIKEAIINTKNFLKKNNIFDVAIVSYNALLPVIYYYYHCPKNKIVVSEKQLLYFFTISQLFSLFGGSSSSTLDKVREKMCVDKQLGNVIIPFNIRNLFDIDLSAGRINAFKISREQVERLVDDLRYGNKKAFVLLCLLQPEITINSNIYDVDHVCSKDELGCLFKKKRGEARKDLENKKNSIPNLQLLAYNQNRGDKNDDTLYTWVVEKKNVIPFDPYLDEPGKHRIGSIEDFLDFYNKRRNMIINYLCECFGIETTNL